MRSIDFRRSALSRIAMLYSGIFALCFILLLGVLLWSATEDVQVQLRDSIQQDVLALSEMYRQQGDDALDANIRLLSGIVEAKRSLYLLEHKDGRVIAGNAASVPPFEGWRELTLSLSADRSDQFFLYGMRLDNKILFVGRRTHNVWEVQEAILQSFAWALCLVIPIMLLGGIALARRAYRRVEAIGDVMHTFVRGDLTQRVPVSSKGDEIDRLALNINYVLQQIEKLMSSLRQVSSDIAHDLRTPLSRLRQRLEQARGKEAANSGEPSTFDEAVDDVDGILATFDALLQIAEIDAGARSARFKEISLTEIGHSIFDIYGGVAEDNHQRLEAEIRPETVARGDRHLLTQLLANLVENAIRHTPPGSLITLSVLLLDGQPSIVVADNGPGIPADKMDLVFERFYRLDASRTTPGNGLGLTMIRAIADLHGADIALADHRPGLEVTIRFPLPRKA
ncbi:MAG: HAMP domain-containing sensor histidine kinase [Dongiaceae bacterium]